MNDEVLLPAEAAEELRCTEHFLRKLARRDEIPHMRVGRGAIRFTRADVDAIRDHLHRPARPAVEDLTTARSRRRRAS